MKTRTLEDATRYRVYVESPTGERANNNLPRLYLTPERGWTREVQKALVFKDDLRAHVTAAEFQNARGMAKVERVIV